MTPSVADKTYADNADDPSIAVVIVGHNPGRFLEEMLESLIHQLDAPDEIIYYDDCSDDGSIQILEQWRGRLDNLKVLKGDKRIGISAARNIANGEVTSNYIAVLDSDDFFLSDTIATYRETLRQDGSVDLIYADTLVFRDGSKRCWRMHYPRFMKSSRATWFLMTSPVLPFKHSSVIYRKKAIEEIGGYCEELPLKVDFDLFVRFVKNGSVIRKLDTATSHHRTHSGQISRERIRGIALYWKIIDWHESRFLFSSTYKILRAFGEVAKLVAGR